jgi:hypothetical protein
LTASIGLEVAMKNGRSIAVGLLVLLAFGCPVRSIFPLFEAGDKALVFEPGLVGKWVDPEGEVLTIRRAGDRNEYLVLAPGGGSEDADKPKTYMACLGKLGDRWFLQTTQFVRSDEEDHLIQVYMIHEIWLTGDKLRLASLDADWLEEMIGKNAIDISHLDRDGELIVTASASELQKLVQRFAADPKAFADLASFTRSK